MLAKLWFLIKPWLPSTARKYFVAHPSFSVHFGSYCIYFLVSRITGSFAWQCCLFFLFPGSESKDCFQLPLPWPKQPGVYRWDHRVNFLRCWEHSEVCWQFVHFLGFWVHNFYTDWRVSRALSSISRGLRCLRFYSWWGCWDGQFLGSSGLFYFRCPWAESVYSWTHWCCFKVYWLWFCYRWCLAPSL